ncbi:MAG: hypothetical protein Q7T41_01170 [Candidatus Saccharibacteria bacterium]|nr:hypothetical protein [Candidatus Saccharibacteria bacterium]
MSDFRLEVLAEGPNCGPCPARDVCPAIAMIALIDETNADLSVASEPLVDRYESSVFVYGTGKLARETAEAQEAIDTCTGSLDYTAGYAPDVVVHQPLVKKTELKSSDVHVNHIREVQHTDEELAEMGISIERSSNEVDAVGAKPVNTATYRTTDRGTPVLLNYGAKDIFNGFRESLKPESTSVAELATELENLRVLVEEYNTGHTNRSGHSEAVLFSNIDRIKADVRSLEEQLDRTRTDIRDISNQDRGGYRGY